MYDLLKFHLQLVPSQILLNANITHGEAPNQHDVLISYKNKLYIIECKTGLKGEKLYNNQLYKTSALERTVGLGIATKSIIFSLSHHTLPHKGIISVDRAKQNKVTVVDRKYMEDEQKLIEVIKKYSKEWLIRLKKFIKNVTLPFLILFLLRQLFFFI